MNLYIDCTSGISGDMMLKALQELGGDSSQAEKLEFPQKHEHEHREHAHGSDHEHSHGEQAEPHHHDGHTHEEEGEHGHKHSHGSHTHRSHREVKAIIENSHLPKNVKETALSIYKVIAAAEAKVHESDVENVHFHEVGRDEAIKNITGIAAALSSLNISHIYCSEIHDGKGFITCSHGTIPVPVPAVMAMRENCDYVFVTDDIETELVTPSGLGVLMGIGAAYRKEPPKGTLLKTAVAKGGRDTGKEGLKVSLIEE